MKANINSKDRMIRMVLAIVFGASFFSGLITGTPGIILLVMGIILLLTALMNFCPVYYFLKISSKKRTNNH